jgi:peptidoglycan/xylan/chitin deacetylase (PgdA/CDA1 family)
MSVGDILKRALGLALPAYVLVRGAKGPSPRVALTFDDGPHADRTRGILDVLAAAGARATFFLQGSEAARHAELVRSIDNGGHQLGNHGWAHSHVHEVPLETFVREAVETHALLEETVGRPLRRIYRPPYGAVTPTAFVALVRRGFRFVFWSMDSEDSFRRDAAQLARWIEAAPVRSGEILLFHEDYPHTLDALPAVVASLKGRAFALVKVNDL